MSNLFLILGYLAIGKLLSRFPRFPRESSEVLNLYIIHVALPALVLLEIPGIVLSGEVLVPALLPWVMVVLSAGAVLLGCRIFRWSRETTGALLLTAPLGNTAFLGIPMVTAFLGEEAVPYALLYDQLGSFPALVLYGSAVLAIYAGGEARPSLVGAVKGIFTFPPFLALLLAIGLRPFTYPEFLDLLLRNLAATMVPVVLIAVGFQLTLKLSREVIAPLVYGLSVKLVLAPVAALLLVGLFGLQGLPVQVSLLQAAMPPMVLAGTLAISANLSPRLCAAMVGLGILASFATLPLLVQYIR